MTNLAKKLAAERAVRQAQAPGRRCAHCGRLGGQSYSKWVLGRRVRAYVHRQCVNPWRGWGVA
jgi:hypothetical protein